MVRPYIRGDAPTRLWAQVEKGPDCWIWTGKPNDSGYGVLGFGGHIVRVHRLAWELTRGPIPDGLLVCHHCDNPRCVKTEGDTAWPDGHLFLGTQADNMADMKAKGRARKGDPELLRALTPEQRLRGSRHPMSKLTEEIIPEIRRLNAAGATELALGKRYGVSGAVIHSVLHGRTWRHVIDADFAGKEISE